MIISLFKDHLKKKVLTVMIVLSLPLLPGFETIPPARGVINVSVSYGEEVMSEVLVGISTSQENLDNSIYVREEETNELGIVRFTGIPAGTYYLDAYISMDDGELYTEAQVVVGSGIVEVEMTLEEENF